MVTYWLEYGKVIEFIAITMLGFRDQGVKFLVARSCFTRNSYMYYQLANVPSWLWSWPLLGVRVSLLNQFTDNPFWKVKLWVRTAMSNRICIILTEPKIMSLSWPVPHIEEHTNEDRTFNDLKFSKKVNVLTVFES